MEKRVETPSGYVNMIIDHAINFRILATTMTMAKLPEEDTGVKSLDSLEEKVSELIGSCKDLVENNTRLHQKQTLMIEKMADLLKRNKAVGGKVNSLIRRLKQIERSL